MRMSNKSIIISKSPLIVTWISSPPLRDDPRGRPPWLNSPAVMATGAAPRATGYDLMCHIKHGIVKNWTDMKKITPEEHPDFPEKIPLNPKANRERMTQTTGETFNVPATYVATQLPVHREGEHSCSAAAEREIVLDEKKKMWYIGLDYDREETYGLPDGSIIIIVGAKRFRCVEVSIQPISFDKEAYGLQDTFFILKCDVDICKNLCAVVVLSQVARAFPRVW